MYDLLDERLISVRITYGSRKKMALPGVLAGLSAGEVDSFPALMTHQKHAWFSFLVQLAAISLHRNGMTDPPRDEDTWRTWLLDLTNQNRNAWKLVVDDLKEPAFMQPPVPERNLGKFTNVFLSPDELDILYLKRNHVVKNRKFQKPKIENWMFALINLQTMDGYGGATKYGIARMDGGYSNRPCVEFIRGFSWSERFLLDVQRLNTRRDDIVRKYGYGGRKCLLWLEPWDGEKQLTLDDLDPWFIEICRRIRFTIVNAQIRVRETGSKQSRIQSEQFCGNVGDPWIPIEKKKKTSGKVKGEVPAALVPGEKGFHYDLAHKLLTLSGISPGICLSTNDSDSGALKSWQFYGWAMVRGEGGTEGIHERLIPIPSDIFKKFRRGETDTIAQLSEAQIKDAAAMEEILGRSLLILIQSAKGKVKLFDKQKNADPRPAEWLKKFTQRVDDIFFERLWAGVLKEDNDQARLDWQEELVQLGRELLEQASRGLPIPAGRYYRALSLAESVYESGWRKPFADLNDRQKRGKHEKIKMNPA